MLTFLAFLMQTVPPPPTLTRLPPIAAPASYPAPPISRAPAEQFTVDVEVRGGGELLWTGPLRVSTAQGTTIRRDRTEPAPKNCLSDDDYSGREQSSFSLQLYAQRARDGANTLRVTVRWTRPAPGSCESRSGARTVELNATTEVPRGQWVTLEGDARLKVRLRRQD